MIKPLNRLVKKLSTASGGSNKLIFMHVPKTGGTSLDRILESHFPSKRESNIKFRRVTEAWKIGQSYYPQASDESPTWFQTINTILCYKIACQAPYLSGHFAVTEELIQSVGEDYRFITILRDPLKRWRSNYIYSRIRLAQDKKRVPPEDLQQELEDYLESDLAKREGAKYVRYLGGFLSPHGLESSEAIHQAKLLLAKFNVVGTLENLTAFENRVSELVGTDLKVPHLRNTTQFQEPGGNTSKTYKKLFTPEIEERVRILCEPDYQVYEYARKNLETSLNTTSA